MKKPKNRAERLSRLLSVTLLCLLCLSGCRHQPADPPSDTTEAGETMPPETVPAETTSGVETTDTQPSESEPAVPSFPLPEPLTVKGWNPYPIAPCTIGEDEDAKAAWHNMIDCLLCGAPSASFPTFDMAHDAALALEENFPPSVLIKVIEDERLPLLHFLYPDGEEDFLQNVRAYGEKIASILSECCLPGASETETALRLYRYVSQNIRYFHKYETGRYQPIEITVWAGLMNGSTICSGYAGAYCTLLRQVGISTLRIIGKCQDEDHSWSMVQLEGKWYHMDPTWEFGESEGKLMIRFGMTDAYRFQPWIGLKALGTGCGRFLTSDLPKATDDRFESCWASQDRTYWKKFITAGEKV